MDGKVLQETARMKSKMMDGNTNLVLEKTYRITTNSNFNYN